MPANKEISAKNPPSPLFSKQLTEAQGELYAFIVMLLAGKNGSDDVLQETNLLLLRNAANYDPSRPFLPWAKAFAYNRVRTYVKECQRNRLVFDEDLMQKIAEDTAEDPVQDDSRLVFLRKCLKELTPLQRKLIDAMYFKNQSVEQIARRFQRNNVSVRVQIHRIRKLLGVCIEGKISAENEEGLP